MKITRTELLIVFGVTLLQFAATVYVVLTGKIIAMLAVLAGISLGSINTVCKNVVEREDDDGNA